MSRRPLTPRDIPPSAAPRAAAAIDGAPGVATAPPVQADPLAGPLPTARQPNARSAPTTPTAATGRLIVSDGDTVTGSVTRINVPDGTLAISGATATYTPAASGGLEPMYLCYTRNGTLGFLATAAMTIASADDGGDGGGTFAYAVNGGAETLPVTLADGDTFAATLSGATAPILRYLTLTRS